MQKLSILIGLLITLGIASAVQMMPNASNTSEMRVLDPDSTTARLFDETMAFARRHDLHENPIGEIMTVLGRRFLDKPYEAGMLDAPAEETLICRLDAFDCVTFVESTLAMARAIKQTQYSYEAWTDLIRDQRYRGGKMDGYCSRLHFFTEWIADNQQRGTVRDITQEIGGVRLEKTIDFMSSHRDSYPRLAINDSVFACIREMEENLRGMAIYYVPQNRIRAIYDRLQPGDIVATATHIEGLDVTHTGLVYDSGEGRKGLLHASLRGGVMVSPDLQSYVEGVKTTIGIIVARPLNPPKS